MKKKFMMTALVAGLLGSTGTAFAANNAQPAPCAQPGVSRTVDGQAAYGRGYGQGPDARFSRRDMRQDRRQNMRQSIKQALNLTDSQETRMIALRRDFYQDSRPVMQSLRNLKRDLAFESVKQSPDKRRIASLTRSIGREHVRMAQLESRHLRKLATVLDAQQIDRLLQMKAQFGDHFRGHPRMKG